MNRTAFLKTMLPALLPLLVFIIADEIWGTTVGIIVATVFGVVEFFYTLIREKRIDYFILADTLLLVILGLVSILLDNSVFFKLKPAFIEAIFCIILGISVFSGRNFLLSMSQRYMKGIQLNQEMIKRMTVSFRFMFWIFIFHTLLVVYAAFFMSDRAWGFVSTALFYILFGIYFISDLLYRRYKAKSHN